MSYLTLNVKREAAEALAEIARKRGDNLAPWSKEARKAIEEYIERHNDD